MTTTDQNRTQASRETDGRYAPSRFDRLCRCGHSLAEHTAARLVATRDQPCLHGSDSSDELCDCTFFVPSELTPKMEEALAIAQRDGVVTAGGNVYQGRVERVAAATIRALIARGLLEHCYSSEGGMAGRLRVEPAAALAEPVEPATPAEPATPRGGE